MSDAAIKESVRQRDGNRCVECGISRQEHITKYGRDLAVHRIKPGSQYSADPGICETLCDRCHGPKPKRKSHEMPSGRMLSVKIKTEKHRRITILAACAGTKISDYLHGLIEKPLAEAWEKFRRE